MWPVINFNDKIFLYTDKIDNKGTNRILPPEFPAVKLSIPQMTPSAAFRHQSCVFARPWLSAWT